MTGWVFWQLDFFSRTKLSDLANIFPPSFLCFGLLFLSLVTVSGKWCQQFHLLPQITLRPAPRSEQINRFFRAAGRDFARLWPVALIIAVFYGTTRAGLASAALPWVVAMGLLATGLIGLTYALILLLLSTHGRGITRVLSLFVPALLFLAHFAFFDNETFGITTLAGLGLAAVLAAVLLTFIAHARYQSIEWGRY